MTVAATTRKAGPYAGNGAQVAFAFGFKVFQASDLYVVLADANGAETVQMLTTNYTVSLNANQDASPGGTVTMLVAPPTGYTLTLGSSVPQAQGLQLANAGGFYPQAINDALDKLTIFAQQMAEQIARSVKVTFSSTTTPDQLLASINTSASNAQASAASASNSASAAASSATAASKGIANQLTTVAGTNTITANSSSVTAYSAGQLYTFTPANTSTGAATLNVNGLGAVVVVKQGSSALDAGDLVAAKGAMLEYDGVQFQLLNPATAASQSQAKSYIQTAQTLTSAAGGTADALTGAFTPAVAALTNGMRLLVRAANANATATPTFAADTTAAKTIVKGNNLALAAGDIAGAGHWIELQYDLTLDKWVLQNPARGVTTVANFQTFTANGNFTVPSNVTKIYVSACAGGGGGGGGGGYGTGYIAAGGGGGAGQSIIDQAYAVTPGQVIAITIGAAGTAGTGGGVGLAGTSGGAGGNTTVGALVTLTGGSGGGFGSSGGAGAGGAGYPAGGDGSGSIAANVGTTVTLYPSGGGGSSPFGDGGGAAAQLAAGSAGKAAVGYGAGGSGSSGVCGGNSVAAQNGGAGAPGVVIVQW